MVRSPFLLAALLPAFAVNAQTPPATFQHTVTDGTTSYVADFELHSARSPNFDVQVQQPNGSFTTHTPGLVRTYIGKIAARPAAMVSGLRRADGSIYYHVMLDDGTEWINNGNGSSVRTDQNWTPNYPTFVTGSGGSGSDVWAAEIGVDLPHSQYQVDGDVAAALEMIEHSVNTVNLLYLRDTCILNYLGRVVIRADAAQDPYAGMTTTSELLDEIRNQWGNVLPPSTNDAGLVATSATGGGLASVGTIGNPGYSANGSSVEGDFTIVWRHEVGHNWSLNHYDGGAPEGGTINSNNALSRMSGPEQARAISHRDARLSSLDFLGPYSFEIPPHPSLDRATFLPQGPAFTIDVLDNDHDANGDAFTIQTFDASSQLGGSITRSVGTGPGGRDELLYTPPLIASAQADLFTYRIVDSTGREGLGYVITALTSDSDLLAHFPMNEGTGTVANDSSPYLGHGNLENGAAWDTGRFGNAIAFDGVDDRVSAPAFVRSTNTYSVTGWVRRDGNQPNFAGIAFCRSRNTTAGLNFIGGNRLNYQWDSILWNSGLEVPNGVWTFVALTVSPTQATVYMDAGNGLQSATNTAAHVPEPFDNSLWLGRDISSVRGSLDDFRVYNRTLTPAEVAIAASGLGNAAEPSPAHLSSINTSTVDLTWTSPPSATSHRIYFSPIYAEVRDRLPQADKGIRTGTSWTPPLLGNGSWFWRVDSSDGTDWVQGPVWAFNNTAGPVAAATQSYGLGCPGSSAQVPTTSTIGLPKVGSNTFAIEVTNAAPNANATFLVAAFSAELPIGTCQLLLGPPIIPAAAIATDNTGRGTLPLPIPVDPAVIGARLFGQFVVIDLGGALFGAASMSDGIHLTVGL